MTHYVFSRDLAHNDERSLIGIRDIIAEKKQYYPNVLKWFDEKIIGCQVSGTRRIFWIGSFDSPSGILIAKRDACNAKICTMWTNPDKRRQGIAKALLASSLEWASGTTVVATAPEEVVDIISPLFTQFNFTESSIETGVYRPNKFEYIFTR